MTTPTTSPWDRGLSIRRDLGAIKSVPAVKLIRGTTVDKLRQSADAFAVWSNEIFACGDF